MSSIIALIPARGGSKRIPRKNVRPFLGVPAIVRTIGTVLASGVERVIVSTDDDEVMRLALDAGAEVPARRPAELADDHATTSAVVRHAIGAWMSEADSDRPLIVVYPTAVLLEPDVIRTAVDRYLDSDADFLVPVLRYPHPVERRLRVKPSGFLLADEPHHLGSRTQDLEPAFHDSGQFYIGSIAAWLREDSILASSRSIAWELPPDSAVDIDDLPDWSRAERLARQRDG